MRPRALARREAEVPEAVARASIGAVIILALNCGTGPGPPVGRWTSACPRWRCSCAAGS